MINAVKDFKHWLADRRDFIFSRYTRDAQETQEPEKSLVELPTEVRQRLVTGIKNLPSNPADQQAIVSALEQAYKVWKGNPNNTNNSAVVLSSPVVAASRILSETLEAWAEEKQIPLRLLPLTARLQDIENIKSELDNYLQSAAEDERSSELEIVVIPNLSWCFLRSLDGLEGIEYIQSLLCDGSKNRFWIIGAGQVGWQYLNSVCGIEAYCGEVFVLPEIESEDLQSWFEPIIRDLDLEFNQPRIDQQIFDSNLDNQTGYFNYLADISQGVGTVAAQVFLKSIRCQDSPEADDHEKQEDKAKPKSLIAVTPSLPTLPDLESADQYLLYSLLLHGDLTIAELAKSLGDLESDVQGQIQLLRRRGVVEQQDKVIKINPIHYPRVKQELAGNNFIIKR
ncbi:MAG: hypothetical protein AAFO95_18975 [Cyanobacteria bacterium J06600_6]